MRPPLWFLWIVLLLTCGLTHAGEPSITVQLGAAQVYAGEPFLVQIKISRQDAAIDAIEPEFDQTSDFEFSPPSLMQGSSSSAHLEGNRAVRTTQYWLNIQYTLEPQRTGDLTVPAATIVMGGQRYRTNPVPIHVIAPPVADFASITLTPSDAVLYVGQALPMRLEWQINRDIQGGKMTGDTLPRGAEVFSVDSAQPVGDNPTTISFMGKSLRATAGRGASGRGLAVAAPFKIIFDEPGVHPVGPVGLVFTAIENGEERRFTASSNTVTIDVRPLPERGRPDGFNGVVGACEIESIVSDATTRVGDPITLSVRIRGEQPPERLPAPLLDLQHGFTDAFRIASEGWIDGGVQGDWHTYSITIRPRLPDTKELPAIDLPYFDPASGEYRIAHSRAIPIKVDGAREITAADAVSAGKRAPATGESLTDGEPGVWANRQQPDRLRNESFDLTRIAASPVVRSIVIAPPLAWAAVAGTLGVLRRRNPMQIRRARLLRSSRRLALGSRASVERQSRAARHFVAAFTDLDPDAVTSKDAATLLEGIDDPAKGQLLDALRSSEASAYGRAPDAPLDRSVGHAIRTLTRLLEAGA